MEFENMKNILKWEKIQFAKYEKSFFSHPFVEIKNGDLLFNRKKLL